jgi:hypothetical protein
MRFEDANLFVFHRFALTQSGSRQVVLAGVFFMILEQLLDWSLGATMTNVLKRNPKLSLDQAKGCVPMVVTRFVGFIHNTVQV